LKKIDVMNKWMHKAEAVIDKLIPPMLVVLLAVIIIEIWFQDIAEHYHTAILIADYCVLSVFLVDVIFKYIRIKPFKKFLRKSWLDILAIFPFAVFFRTFEAFFGFSQTLERGQMILHESLEAEKEVAKIVQETEKIAKVSRTSRFSRFIRPIARAPRFVKAFAFYEKPTGKHYHYEKKGGENMKMKNKNEYCWNCIISSVLVAVGLYSLVLGVKAVVASSKWFVADGILLLILGMLFVFWGKDLKKVC
jgi:hypothetical protein